MSDGHAPPGIDLKTETMGRVPAAVGLAHPTRWRCRPNGTQVATLRMDATRGALARILNKDAEG